MKFVLSRAVFYQLLIWNVTLVVIYCFRESSVCNPEVIMFGCLLNHARMVSSACEI